MKHLKYLLFFLFGFLLLSCKDLNQIAKVDYSFQGCFGSGTSELEILKRGNDTIATLKLMDGKMLRNRLNTSQIACFKQFIKELKLLREGGYCTTKESFVAYYDYNFIKKTTARCDWHGFDKLKKALFSLKE